MTIQNWFPTSIYYEPLQKTKLQRLNKELRTESYQIMEMDDEGRDWSEKKYVGGYTSFASHAELHRMSSTFMELEKKISKHVSAFAEHLEFDLGAGNLEMTDCWVNIMPAQTTHSGHIHPLSVISGTYYVQTPSKASGIKFEDPRLERFMAAPPRKQNCTKRNKTFAEYKAKEGHVVLFESWLRHEVPASITTEDRISISFNYNWV